MFVLSTPVIAALAFWLAPACLQRVTRFASPPGV